MSFFQEDGVLTSRTDEGTDVVTLTGSGASLDVKLVRLTLNGATATGGANADYSMSFGMSDGTNGRCISAVSKDNVGSMIARESAHNDNSIVAIYSTAGTLIDQATISAIGTGTFTVNWTIKSGTAYKIGWTSWGGTDLTDVEVGDFDSDTTSGAHSQSVVTTLKSADAGFFFAAGVASASQNTSQTSLLHHYGFADANLNQGVSSVTSRNSGSTSATYRYQVTTGCFNQMSSTAGALKGLGTITAFDATNGIELDWSSDKDTAARPMYYALVKGGRWEVGSGTTHTSAATKPYTTTFQPVGVSTASVNNTTSASVVGDNHLSIGSTDGTTSYSFSAGDNDNKGQTETGTYHSTANVVQTFTATELTAGGGIASLVGAGTLDSLNALDFTLDYTGNADSALREFIWLACAADAAAGGLLIHPGMAGGMDDLVGGLRA